MGEEVLGLPWQEWREPHSPRARLASEQGLHGRGGWRRACGPPPESQAVRSFALLLPLVDLFVPLAKGTQVLPVLLVSFSSSACAWGGGGAQACYLESPPHCGGGREGAGQEPAGQDKPRG